MFFEEDSNPEYKILPSLLWRYGMKQFLRFMKFMLFIIVILGTVLYLSHGSSNLIPFLIFIFVLVVVISIFEATTYKRFMAYRYIVDSDRISANIDAAGLNAYALYSLQQRELAPANNFITILRYTQINTIIVSDNEISIRSKEYSFWNRKGQIVIPNEIGAESFEHLIDHLKSIADRYPRIYLLEK